MDNSIAKAEVFRFIRANQDTPKKTLWRDLKQYFPELDSEQISSILLELIETDIDDNRVNK